MIFEGRCHGGGGDKSHEPTAECVAYNCLPTKLLPSWIIRGLFSQQRGQSARGGGVGVGGPEVDKDSAGGPGGPLYPATGPHWLPLAAPDTTINPRLTGLFLALDK